jgi:hypothetical protein
MRITRRHALKAVLMRACFVPQVGLKDSALSTDNLIWAENNGIAEREEIIKSGGLPLWVRSGDGSGYGYGFGYGDGSGDGYGCGSGYGCGNGDGDGDGSGSSSSYEEAFKKLKLI